MVDVMSAYAVSGGFTDAAAIVNKLPQDVLAEMCQMILKFIKHDTGIIDTATLLSKCQSAGYSCTQEAVQSAVNVVAHIYRTASRGCLGADELSNQLQGSATWSEEAVAVIVQFWQQQTALSEMSQQSCHSVNTGKLIDLQWKLGVSVRLQRLQEPQRTLCYHDDQGR
ncbi:hypothetical protein NP493_76g05040 [Ridgeia piscesae]|uniref:COMM domain-containing protein n=1 Tax=Ridgeia piscesae TaxID=27915 RepID=A0AAD9P9J0_RIDPI|nr:hypothetical protein NP493_76g05040 [Ridgeia piscesae]